MRVKVTVALAAALIPPSRLFGAACDFEFLQTQPLLLVVAFRVVMEPSNNCTAVSWRSTPCCRVSSHAMLPALVLSAAGRSVVQFVAHESVLSNKLFARMIIIITIIHTCCFPPPRPTSDHLTAQASVPLGAYVQKRALALLPESDPALLFAMTSSWNVVIGRVQESTVNRHKISTSAPRGHLGLGTQD